MTANQGRKFIIFYSLGITGFQIVFLFVAPAIGFPLEYPKNFTMLQIITPVFLGYLGSAVHYLFASPAPAVKVNTEYLGPLVRGPIIIYVIATVAAFAAFWYSNRQGVPVGNSMSADNLSTAISIALGLLAVTTGVIVSYLFTGSAPNNINVNSIPTDRN